jgi:NhaA family Na+:H+ antiporter
VTRALKFAFERYLVLPLGAVIAIVWANTDAVSYFRMANALAFLVNDVGMAFFVAYLAQEVIEAAMPGGTLHPWRRSVVPGVAALGGTLGAIAVYGAYIHAGDEDVLVRGWPIACAVDTFFCLAIARNIFHRGAAPTFLLMLAIASNIVGLIVISLHSPIAEARPAAAVLIVLAIGISASLRRAHVASVWPYVWLSGSLAWLGCYWSGLHPALALLPIVPFLAHTPRDLNVAGGAKRDSHEKTDHFEHVFEYPVQVVAFLFALVNAGVLLRGFGTGTWAVLTASLIGRPVGILAAVGIAVAAGLHLPRQVGWRDLVVIALAASPGLTFGVFFATAIFPSGPLLIEAKIGAMATVAGVLLSLSAAYLLRVGRFASLAAPPPRLHTALTRERP